MSALSYLRQFLLQLDRINSNMTLYPYQLQAFSNATRLSRGQVWNGLEGLFTLRAPSVSEARTMTTIQIYKECVFGKKQLCYCERMRAVLSIRALYNAQWHLENQMSRESSNKSRSQ